MEFSSTPSVSVRGEVDAGLKGSQIPTPTPAPGDLGVCVVLWVGMRMCGCETRGRLWTLVRTDGVGRGGWDRSVQDISGRGDRETVGVGVGSRVFHGRGVVSCVFVCAHV